MYRPLSVACVNVVWCLPFYNCHRFFWWVHQTFVEYLLGVITLLCTNQTYILSMFWLKWFNKRNDTSAQTSLMSNANLLKIRIRKILNTRKRLSFSCKILNLSFKRFKILLRFWEIKKSWQFKSSLTLDSDYGWNFIISVWIFEFEVYVQWRNSTYHISFCTSTAYKQMLRNTDDDIRRYQSNREYTTSDTLTRGNMKTFATEGRSPRG